MVTPSELLVDTEETTRSVAVTPALAAALPSIQLDFETIDAAYNRDPEAYLKTLENSAFELEGVNDRRQTVPCSLLADSRTDRSGEIFVTFAPFADGAPQTSAEQLVKYLDKEESGLSAKRAAKPGSWNQITKSSVIYELLIAQGRGMPVLTIFSLVPPRAYTLEDRADFRLGDYTPAGAVVKAAMKQAQSLLHSSDGETQLSKVHLHGASLGASNAVGAATLLNHRLHQDETEVMSVTAQELILGPRHFHDLMKRFMIKKYVGDTSDIQLPSGQEFVPEPAIRRAIDAHGSEAAMYLRRLRAMSKLSYLRGLVRPGAIQDDIGRLSYADIPVTVANAHDSSLTEETAYRLSRHEKKLKLIDIRAKEGQRAGHDINEHVGLVAIVAALGVKGQLRSWGELFHSLPR